MRWMKDKCSIRGCANSSNTRGWCKPHYDAWFRTGDPNNYRGDRSHLSLWDKINEIGWTRNKSTGCNEWNGYRNQLGYGQFREGNSGKLVRVHRVVYEKLVGPLTDGEHVMHVCDNPACSELKHLRKGRARDNMRDMRKKKRGYKDNWTHCPNGHPYSDDIPPRSTKNRCRECTNERNRRYYARKRSA